MSRFGRTRRNAVHRGPVDGVAAVAGRPVGRARRFQVPVSPHSHGDGADRRIAEDYEPRHRRYVLRRGVEKHLPAPGHGLQARTNPEGGLPAIADP